MLVDRLWKLGKSPSAFGAADASAERRNQATKQARGETGGTSVVGAEARTPQRFDIEKLETPNGVETSVIKWQFADARRATCGPPETLSSRYTADLGIGSDAVGR